MKTRNPAEPEPNKGTYDAGMVIELLTDWARGPDCGRTGCSDRMPAFGTLPKICFAGGMTSFLLERNIRIRLPGFVEPFRNRIRENAEKLAADTGVEIEFICKRNFRKEERMKEALAKRGEYPGMVCIFFRHGALLNV